MVLSTSAELREVFKFAPEWEGLFKNWEKQETLTLSDFLVKVGAKSIYNKILGLAAGRAEFLKIVRDYYYLPVLLKMLQANQNLRRFLNQRYLNTEEQCSQAMSFSVELAQKMEGFLVRQLTANAEDGFKVLLPAYIQRSVHNAVIDFIRQESVWEKSTLQDLHLDPELDDPRTTVADDATLTPENQIISGEMVGQLNELRQHLNGMLKDEAVPSEPLIVLDCMFGLGLTLHSVVGQEMTMRECCEKLGIQGDTMARRIARCQVLMDKGLEMVRQRIYQKLPGIADCWQRSLNVNTASRRELTQQLGMTEGEIDRLIKGRQFASMAELVNCGVIKSSRLDELNAKGASAVFVPVDLNSATSRDIIDILGLDKDLSKRLVMERPFREVEELVTRKLISAAQKTLLLQRGAVIKKGEANLNRLDLNRAAVDEFAGLGLPEDLVIQLMKVRPFLTWSELEEFLGADSQYWSIFRQKFFLGLVSG